MVSLFSPFPSLALRDTGQLLDFSMKLLDLPTKATNLFGSLCGLDTYIVCDDVFRTVFSRNTE